MDQQRDKFIDGGSVALLLLMGVVFSTIAYGGHLQTLDQAAAAAKLPKPPAHVVSATALMAQDVGLWDCRTKAD
jgi:hypothetical protein